MNDNHVNHNHVHISTYIQPLRLPRTAKELYALNDSDPRKQGFIDALTVELQQMHDTNTFDRTASLDISVIPKHLIVVRLLAVSHDFVFGLLLIHFLINQHINKL